MDSPALAPSSVDSGLERDLLPVLQTAEARCRRWRGLALALGGVILLLLPTALVQAYGTFTALRISREAQQQAACINDETAKQEKTLEASHQRLLAAEAKVQEALLRLQEVMLLAERNRRIADGEAAVRLGFANAVESETQLQHKLVKELELRRREIEQEVRNLKELETEYLKQVYPGHQPDTKQCPAGLRGTSHD